MNDEQRKTLEYLAWTLESGVGFSSEDAERWSRTLREVLAEDDATYKPTGKAKIVTNVWLSAHPPTGFVGPALYEMAAERAVYCDVLETVTLDSNPCANGHDWLGQVWRNGRYIRQVCRRCGATERGGDNG